jgi:hypothetical protein
MVEENRKPQENNADEDSWKREATETARRAFLRKFPSGRIPEEYFKTKTS